MTTAKYPDVHVKLTGEDGNAFAVMGATARALRRAGVPQSEITAYHDEAMSGDYNNLLMVTMNWVDVS